MALKVRRAVWIGHSLGAQVVVRIAERSGRTWRPASCSSGRRARRDGGSCCGRRGGSRSRRGARRCAVIGAVARDYIRTSPLRYLGTWLRHGDDDLLARLRHVQCPALVLAGDADPVCRPAFIELLRHRMPRARVEWVRGGTHALPRGHAARSTAR
jgi:pimeloyl-ACP methyl ester carboxylesterase